MAQTLNILQSPLELNQLDTYNYTIPAAGMYCTNLNASIQPGSSLSMVIKLNGVTKFTSVAPQAGDNHVDLPNCILNCAQSDTLAIVLSSSNAVDQGPQGFKCQLRIDQGLT